MKTLYFDCGMGAAGDMLTAALLELVPDPDAFMARLNALGIPGVKARRESAVKCGITGTHVSVTVDGEEEESLDVHEHEHHHHDDDHEHEHEHEHHHDHDHDHDHEHEHEHEHEHHHDHDHEHEHEHDHEHDHDHEHHHHHHSGLHDIEHVVSSLNVSDRVKKDVMDVYGLIAEAESAAHGVSVSEIHFHEVGTMDAVADITAVCMLMEALDPDEVVVSPVHVGSGKVRCAHGILPVPAPATAYILKDAPIYGGRIEGELCTPTGAALLKHFAARFGDMPVMRVEKIGYGMGKKDFPAANCVRAMLGQTSGSADAVYELSFNVDDMTAEDIGFATERLFDGGALEVYTVSVGMKKNRPGTLVRVLCRPEDRQKMAELIFRHTTTIGVREASYDRYVLDRSFGTVSTPAGQVRIKRVSGYGVTREKAEYDDLARIAREKGLSLADVRAMIEKA